MCVPCVILGAALPADVAAAPASPEAMPSHLWDPLTGLVAVGLCVLVVWVIRRLRRPGKFTLARTPGRANSITPVHILLPLVIWFALQAVLRVVKPDELRLAGLAAGQILWLAVSLIVAAATFRLGLRRGLGLSMRHWIYDTARAIVGYLAVFPICLGLLMLFVWLLPQETQRTNVMLVMLKGFSTPWLVLAIFSVVVLAPLAEEVFFRGLCQSMLRTYSRSAWVAIIITAAFFGLVHAPYWQDIPALFALAVVMGYNYERSGRLYPAILIHAIFNAVSIAVFLSRMQ